MSNKPFPQTPVLTDEELGNVTIPKMMRSVAWEDILPFASDVAKAQARASDRNRDKQWIEWGEEFCPHPTLSYYFSGKPIKRTCKACWEALQKLVEECDEQTR